MSLDIERTFKMNSDFWPQARGPPGTQQQQQQQQQPQTNNFMDTSNNDYRQQQQQQNFHATDNNVDMKEHLMANPVVDSQNNFQNNSSGFQGMSSVAAAAAAVANGQGQPIPSTSPGAENSSPEVKFNAEKLVHEIQVSFDYFFAILMAQF